jgi:farnesyl-diphosphate farnesyltransferase
VDPQRSSAKITFPAYWANTCCSHPLSTPLELEERESLGVKRAARRKLEQELGISPKDVPLSSFRFLTRIHYMAGCGDGVWGEHEVDHILVCTPARMPKVSPNPNEVDEARWFHRSELRAFVDDAETGRSSEKISPWFGIIEKTLLGTWWTALEEGRIAEHVDPKTIHRADDLPEEAFLAGQAAREAMAAEKASAAAPPRSLAAVLPDGGSSITTETEADVKKQGAYGKVKIHSEGTISQLLRLDEMFLAATYKLGLSSSVSVSPLPEDTSSEYLWCEEMLCRTSRSFALVIQQLPLALRRSVCIFYLVLRGLDTVEDDMEAYKGKESEKYATLRSFWKHLDDASFSIDGVGEGDEKALIRGFGRVAQALCELPVDDQAIITDICARMGEGMAQFASKDLRGGTDSLDDYNLYCHYVAGLVGEGLSQLFSSLGYESPAIGTNTALSNDMGLFLQKTNIIRDYLEDLVEGRAFWPKEVWGIYAPTLDSVRSSPQALACLNHMVADALQHAPHSLRYLEQLKDPEVFRFCAIPQLMAIATLDKLVNNPDVFTGVVKIRKGLALKIVSGCNDMAFVYDFFLNSARNVALRIPSSHSLAWRAAQTALEGIEAVALPKLPASSLEALFSTRTMLVVLAIFGGTLYHLYYRSNAWEDGLATVPHITDIWDVLFLAVMVACILYCFAFLGLPVILFGSADGSKPIAEPRKAVKPVASDPSSTAVARLLKQTEAHRFEAEITKEVKAATSLRSRATRRAD